MYYAGIGSRETPVEILDWFTTVGKYLSKKGCILRSGGADGADLYFEKGCDKVAGKKEIFIPWKGFNGSSSTLYEITPKMYAMAETYHPYWHNLKDGAKKLHARNCCQVLGADLKNPSSFIICYTENGKMKGGTAQALRIAISHKIPIFNAGAYNNLAECKEAFKIFISDFIVI